MGFTAKLNFPGKGAVHPPQYNAGHDTGERSWDVQDFICRKPRFDPQSCKVSPGGMTPNRARRSTTMQALIQGLRILYFSLLFFPSFSFLPYPMMLRVDSRLRTQGALLQAWGAIWDAKDQTQLSCMQDWYCHANP